MSQSTVYEGYVIREKGTENYMPTRWRYRRGHSFSEPQPYGGDFGPRIFPTWKSAHNALCAWAQGHWEHSISRATSFFDEYDEFTIVKKVEGRSKDKMEIVPVRVSAF
jgi:hypothetical protein